MARIIKKKSYKETNTYQSLKLEKLDVKLDKILSLIYSLLRRF